MMDLDRWDADWFPDFYKTNVNNNRYCFRVEIYGVQSVPPFQFFLTDDIGHRAYLEFPARQK